MGKNKARHILHGVLDCLPIILIPIFAIYSQNHEINDNTLTINESYYENNILYQTNEVNSVNDIVSNNIYHFDSLEIDSQDLNESNLSDLAFYIYYCEDYSMDFSDVELFEYDFFYNLNNQNASVYVNINEGALFYSIYVGDSFIQTNLIDFLNVEFTNIDLVIRAIELNTFKSFMTYKNILPSASDYKVIETIYHENTPITYDAICDIHSSKS